MTSSTSTQAPPSRTPALAPVCVIPRRPSIAIEPLAFLQKIAAIEINDVVQRNGVLYFVVDVYLKRFTSRIPTNQQKQQQSTSNNSNLPQSSKHNSQKTQHLRREKPDYQLEKRFSDFADLRYHVWVFAQKNHGCKCAYCDAFMDFIIYSLSQPRLLVRLATTTAMRKKLFTNFCNEFVRLAVGKCERRNQCEGVQAIPTLVERFFREQDE